MLVQTRVTKPCTSDGEVLGSEVGKYVFGASGIADTGIEDRGFSSGAVTVFDLQGAPACRVKTFQEAFDRLKKGIYVVDGKKVMIR